MRRLLVCAVLALAAFTASAQPHSYAYTGAKADPVISLDYRGSRVPRIDDAPTLSIYADGRVVMPQTYAHSRAYTGQISQAELQALLDLIIRQKHFLAFDEKAVQAKLRAQPGGARALPEHLSTTVIHVNAHFVSKTVSYFGLGHQRAVAETEQLLAIRDRLDQVMSVMKLGGRAEAERWLALANAERGKRAPASAALTLDDLDSVAVRNDGSADVRFARVGPDVAKSVSVTISMDEQGESHVAVAEDDLLSSQQREIR